MVRIRASPGNCAFHHLREVGGHERRPAPRPGERLPPRRVELPRREHPPRRELPEHPVASCLRRPGVDRGVVADGGAGEGGQHRDLPQGELVRLLAEVEPRRRPDPLDVAAIRREVQVQLQNLVLRKPPLDLHRPEALADLRPQSPRPRIGHAGHLHGDRRSPGNHLAMPQVRDHRPRHRERIDPRMAIEPLVLRGHQRLPYLGGQLRQPHRQPPALVRRQEEPERLPLAVRHHHGRRALELLPGEREEEVQRPEPEPGGGEEDGKGDPQGDPAAVLVRLFHRVHRCLHWQVAAAPSGRALTPPTPLSRPHPSPTGREGLKPRWR